MSDDGTMASGSATPGQVQDTGSSLYDTGGMPLRPRASATSQQTDQLAGFVQERPFTAALTALIIGYFIGRIT